MGTRSNDRFEDGPPALGPYAQAVKVGDLVYTSGSVPLDPATGKFVEGEIEAQATQSLKNLKTVVEASGSELGKVVKTTVRQSLCWLQWA